jgi:hypothetical protein
MKKTTSLNTTTSLSTLETISGNTNPDQITLDMITELGTDNLPTTTTDDTTDTGEQSPTLDTMTEPEPLPEPRIIEMTGNKGTFKIIHPDDLPEDTDKTPISKRMDELLLIQMDEGTRFSGDHPTIKKHPKWMINPSINGKERWMDLPKQLGWNLKERYIILTRNQTNFKEMNSRIIGRIQIIE